MTASAAASRRGPAAPVLWARAVAGLVATAALVVAGSAGPGLVGAQGVGGAPADRWAPVVDGPAVAPVLSVSAFWVDAGGGAEAAPVVVRLADGVVVDDGPWRVSVSVGDPAGSRTRASAVADAGTVSGRVERGDGERWEDAGATTATAGDGTVTVSVPLADVGADALAWVEVEATVEDGTSTATTPWFAWDDLLGTRPGPAVGVASAAVVADDPGAGPVGLPSPGPTLAVVGRGLEVTTTEAAPLEVDGSAVLDLVDTVVVVRDGDDGTTRTDRVEIDRGTGEVRLVPADAEPVVAAPGIAPWLVSGPSPTDPGGPATVTFDVEALDVALGGPVLERDSTAVGLTRTAELDDGRTVQAPGVVATMAWFDTALLAGAADTGGTGADEASTLATPLVVGAVVLVAVAVLVASVVLLRRRRTRPVGPSRPAPTAGGDPLAALFAEVDELSARVDRLTDPDPDPDLPRDPDSRPGAGGPVEPGR